ncbi:MAG: respiratory nitrate reductase subunit gamma [Planctomycetes bacterium]|nr:respiratory nitrate reductase subunit gamma [Planctomycetota bacterium]
MTDFLLFVALPYLSLAVFFLMTILRYRMRPFTYTSLSSQFLENKQHFWSSVPFHYGILSVFAVHLAAFLLPREILAWNASPLRLILLEVTGFGMALVTLAGLFNIVMRRVNHSRARRVTNLTDWILYAFLLVQVVSGMCVAILHGWGSSWFSTSASPWIWSLLSLQPDASYVSAMPWLVKLHFVNAFLIFGIFPFTRLVHVLVVPNPYLWRRPQVVLWNRDRKKVRSAD